MLIIGVDPGATGAAIAIYDNQITDVCRFSKETVPDVASWFVRMYYSDAVVYLEKVHATPQMGVVSAFKFGRGVGLLDGILAAAELRTIEVSPQRWQTAVGAQKRKSKLGESNTDHKRKLKEIAQRLYPPSRWLEPQKITNDVADALLIAEYGWRQERQLFNKTE